MFWIILEVFQPLSLSRRLKEFSGLVILFNYQGSYRLLSGACLSLTAYLLYHVFLTLSSTFSTFFESRGSRENQDCRFVFPSLRNPDWIVLQLSVLFLSCISCACFSSSDLYIIALVWGVVNYFFSFLSSGYSQSASLLAHNQITASQFIRRGLYPSWYKQVPTHCLLLFAIEAGDFLDLLKSCSLAIS